jgi:CO/xanthine dehydrogenase FAD-binding subunit
MEGAARLAGANLEDISSDIHASQEYRRAMIPVFTRRALERAASRS